MLFDVITEYCQKTIYDMPKVFKYNRLLQVPNMQMKNRKSSWPQSYHKIYQMREKDKCVIINDFEDEVDAFWMIAKLSNLKYAEGQIDHFKKRFFDKNEDFSDMMSTLNANMKETSTIIAYKLVYTNMRPLIFEKLYFDDDEDKMMTLDTLIDNLTPLMKDLKDFTDRSIFSTLMGTVLDIFTECYVDYLSVFLIQVAHENFQAPNRIIEKDVQVFMDYFSQGGVVIKVDTAMQKVLLASQMGEWMRMDERQLSEKYKQSEEKKQRDLIC